MEKVIQKWCRNCGAPISDTLEQCTYCGSWLIREKIGPLRYIAESKRIRMKGIYPFFFIAGFAALFIIYFFFFDAISERVLVRISPLWFMPIIFGLYGYRAESLLDMIARGEAEDFREAYSKWSLKYLRENPIPAMAAGLIFLTIPWFRWKKPLMVALTGTVFWGVLLIVFFEGIFPSL